MHLYSYDYYDLRPEVLESNLYAWRASGNIKYYNNAVLAMNAILNATAVGGAFAPINNVAQLNSVSRLRIANQAASDTDTHS